MDSLVLIIMAVVLVVAVAMFAGIGALNKKRSGLDHAFYQKEWQKIEGFKHQGKSGWLLAVFEADKLLDRALKDRGFAGTTMGERLKSANRAFMNTNAIWDAHKLRNHLAHEHGISLSAISVEKTLNSFKAGLKDLGAL